MAVCSSSPFRSGVSVYLPGGLPPDSVTKWLPAPSQLASYWSPNCSSAFGFIVLYWCVLKWLSHTLRADICAFECTHTPTFWKLRHTINIQHFCQAYIHFKGSYLIMSLTLLLHSSSPSWVVSYCLGQINQPSWPLAAERKTGREVFMEQGLLLEGRSICRIDSCGSVCVCVSVYVCHFTISQAIFHLIIRTNVTSLSNLSL